MIHLTRKTSFETGTTLMVDGIERKIVEVDFTRGIKVSVPVPGLGINLDDWIEWAEIANISFTN